MILVNLIWNKNHALKNVLKSNNATFMFLFTFFTMMMLLSINTIYLQDPHHFPSVFAHVTEQFGNITLEIGWSTEPPLVDEMNDIIIFAARQSPQTNETLEEFGLEPIRNALTDINIMVRYGGITKQLNFVPSAESAGLYESSIIPTRIGSYSVVLNGTIQNQAINTEIPIEDVESKEGLTFPPQQQQEALTSQGAPGVTGGIGADDTTIGSNLQNILSELDNAIRLNTEDMTELSNNTQNLQDSIEELREQQNLPYMLAVTAIGISIGAVLISGFTISRRKGKQNK